MSSGYARAAKIFYDLAIEVKAFNIQVNILGPLLYTCPFLSGKTERRLFPGVGHLSWF